MLRHCKSEIVKDEFNKLVTEKLCDASITDYLKKQSAIDNMSAERIFK
jgi:hypothetical protein